jgi:ribonuclease III
LILKILPMTKTPSEFFKDPQNFRKALIHKSYCNEHPGEASNERLEFLGDSVLSVIISDRLFRLFPNLPEGELTSRRSCLVQTLSLAEKAKLLHLDDLLLLSKGEEDSGGRHNTSLLANTFEAVLGSLFLDSGFITCQEYLFEVFPDSDLTGILQTKDPKSLLQEKTQSQNLGTPQYATVETSGPDHAKTFTVGVKINGSQIATGTGSSKQRAETEAARAALAKLF